MATFGSIYKRPGGRLQRGAAASGRPAAGPGTSGNAGYAPTSASDSWVAASGWMPWSSIAVCLGGPALKAVAAEAVSVGALVVVLAWAVARPRGWPEAVAAVPAAIAVIATGAISPVGISVASIGV